MGYNKNKIRIVQCSCLGNFGRFGNSLIQYAFAKSYAIKHNAELQIPEDWIGRKLFKEISDPTIKEPLPKTRLDKIPWGIINIDLFGYFQNKEHYDIISLSNIRKWFTFKNEIKERYPKKKNYYIAAHVRRGDYKDLQHLYCLISQRSYLKACEKFGLDQKDIIWVGEDNPEVDEYAKALGADYLPDFFTLLNADVILRANSTFSVMAGFLSNAKVYSPVSSHLSGPANVDFVEGNYPKILSVLDDFVFKE